MLKTHPDSLNANVVWNIEQGLKLSVSDLNKAQENRLQLVLRVQEFYSRYPILLTPATVVPPYPVTQNHVSECDGHTFDNYYQWLSIAYAFTTSLSPAISIPAGFHILQFAGWIAGGGENLFRGKYYFRIGTNRKNS